MSQGKKSPILKLTLKIICISRFLALISCFHYLPFSLFSRFTKYSFPPVGNFCSFLCISLHLFLLREARFTWINRHQVVPSLGADVLTHQQLRLLLRTATTVLKKDPRLHMSYTSALAARRWRHDGNKETKFYILSTDHKPRAICSSWNVDVELSWNVDVEVSVIQKI